VKIALKYVDFDKVTDKTKLAPFYGPRYSLVHSYLVIDKIQIQIQNQFVTRQSVQRSASVTVLLW